MRNKLDSSENILLIKDRFQAKICSPIQFLNRKQKHNTEYNWQQKMQKGKKINYIISRFQAFQAITFT